MRGITLDFRTVAPAMPYHAALIPIPDGPRACAPHDHADFHELMYVTKGAGTHRVNGSDQALGLGRIVLVRPADRHCFGECSADLHLVNVAFPSERWRSFLDFSGIPWGRHWDEQAVPPIGEDPDGHLAAAFMASVTSFAHGPRPFDLVSLLVAVAPWIQTPQGSQVGTPRPEWLTAACAAMRHEENLAAGLDRFLDLANVSHGHLARSMAFHSGCTPGEYVMDVRLSHASVLLVTAAGSVADVSFRCGFGSQSYFGRKFREKYGITPLAYRHRNRRAAVPSPHQSARVEGS